MVGRTGGQGQLTVESCDGRIDKRLAEWTIKMESIQKLEEENEELGKDAREGGRK